MENDAGAVQSRENALRGLAAIPKRDVEQFRALDKPPLQARHVLEASCVILGLEPPKPPVIDTEPVALVVRYAQKLFVDWTSLLRDCEKALLRPLAAPVGDRLRKILEYREYPSADWARTNSRLIHALMIWIQTVDMADRHARARGVVGDAPSASTRGGGSPRKRGEREKEQAGSILSACRTELMDTSLAAVAQLRSVRNPPPGVRAIAECVCRMLGKPPAIIPGTDVEEYWMALQSLLGDWRNTCTSLQVLHPTAVRPDALEAVRSAVTSTDAPDDSDILRIGGPLLMSLTKWLRAIERLDSLLHSTTKVGLAGKGPSTRAAVVSAAAAVHTLANDLDMTRDAVLWGKVKTAGVPAAVLLTAEAACLCLGLEPILVSDFLAPTAPPVKDWWSTLVRDSADWAALLSHLRAVEVAKLPQISARAIKEITMREDFPTEEGIAAYGRPYRPLIHLRKWVTAVIASFEARHGPLQKDGSAERPGSSAPRGGRVSSRHGSVSKSGGDGTGSADPLAAAAAGGDGGGVGRLSSAARMSASAAAAGGLGDEETINDAVRRERRRLRMEAKVRETAESLAKAKKAEEEAAGAFSAELEKLRTFSTEDATAVRKQARPGTGVFITVGSLFTLLTGGRVATEWAACRQLLSEWTGLLLSMAQFDPYTAQRGAIATIRRNLRDATFPSAAALSAAARDGGGGSPSHASAHAQQQPHAPGHTSSGSLGSRLPQLVVHLALWVRATEAVVSARQSIDFLVSRQQKLGDGNLTEVEEEDALILTQQKQREAAERARAAQHAAPLQTPSQRLLAAVTGGAGAAGAAGPAEQPRGSDFGLGVPGFRVPSTVGQGGSGDGDISSSTARLALLATEPLARTREQRLQSRTDRAATALAACDEAVENALAEYEALGPASLADLRANPNPGPAVVDALTCAYILLVEPRAADWLTVKRILLMDWQGLLRELRNFDRDMPNSKALEVLRAKLASNGFTREAALKKISPAAALLCAWARAVERYDLARRELLEHERHAAEAKDVQLNDEERERAMAMALRRPLEEVPTHVLAEVDSGVTAATAAATSAAEKAHAQLKGALAVLEENAEVLGKLGGMLVPPQGVSMLVSAIHCALKGPGFLDWLEARTILVPGTDFVRRLREAADGDLPVGGLGAMRAVMRMPTFPKDDVLIAAHPATAALLLWARGLESMERATAAMSAAAAEHGGTRAMGLIAALRLGIDTLEEVANALSGREPSTPTGGLADFFRSAASGGASGAASAAAVDALLRQNKVMLAALRQMLNIARDKGRPDPAAAAAAAAGTKLGQHQQQAVYREEENYEEAALMADIVDAGGPAVLIRLLAALPAEQEGGDGRDSRLHVEVVEFISELALDIAGRKALVAVGAGGILLSFLTSSHQPLKDAVAWALDLILRTDDERASAMTDLMDRVLEGEEERTALILQLIATLSRRPNWNVPLRDAGVLHLLAAQLHAADLEVACDALELLESLCEDAHNAIVVMNCGAPQQLAVLLRIGRDNARVGIRAAALIAVLMCVEPNRYLVRPTGIIGGLVALLEADLDCQVAALEALTHIVHGHPVNAAALRLAGAIPVLEALLRASSDEDARDAHRKLSRARAKFTVSRVAPALQRVEMALMTDEACERERSFRQSTSQSHEPGAGMSREKVLRVLGSLRLERGYIEQLVVLMQIGESVESADSAHEICYLAMASHENRMAILEAGGVPALVGMLNYGPDAAAAAHAAETLLAMAESFAVHNAMIAANLAEVATPVVTHTSSGATKLLMLLTVVRAYSGRMGDNRAAKELFAGAEVATSVLEILDAVLHRDGEYVTAKRWSLAGAVTNVRMAAQDHMLRVAMASDTSGMRNLVAALRFATTHEDLDVQRSAVTAMVNLCATPALADALRAAGVPDAVRLHVVSQDALLADAARAVLLHLGDWDEASALRALRESVAGGRSGRPAEFGPDEEVPSFDVFISHVPGEATDFVVFLRNFFWQRGFSTYDNETDRRDMMSLKAVISEAQNVLLVLTEGALANKWCLMELAEAVACGKNVVLVVREGSRWPDTDSLPPPAPAVASAEVGVPGTAAEAEAAAAAQATAAAAAAAAAAVKPPSRTLRFPSFAQLRTLPPEVQGFFRMKPVEHAEQYLRAFMQDLLVRIKLDPHRHSTRNKRAGGGGGGGGGADFAEPSMSGGAFGGGGAGVAGSLDGRDGKSPEDSFQAMQAEMSDKRSLARSARQVASYGMIASGERPYSRDNAGGGGGGGGGRPWSHQSQMQGGGGGGLPTEVLMELAAMRDAQMRTAATLQTLAEIQAAMLQTQQETLRASLAAQHSLNSLVGLMRQSVSPGRAFRDGSGLTKSAHVAKENVAASVVAQVNALRAALAVPEIIITRPRQGSVVPAPPMFDTDDDGGGPPPRRVATAIGSERPRRGGAAGAGAGAGGQQAGKPRGRPLPPLQKRRSPSPTSRRRSPSPPSAWVTGDASPLVPVLALPQPPQAYSSQPPHGSGRGGVAAGGGFSTGRTPLTLAGHAEMSGRALDSLYVSPEASGGLPGIGGGGGVNGNGNGNANPLMRSSLR